MNQADALEQATLESIQYKTAYKKYKMLHRREQDKNKQLQKEYDAERYEHLDFAKQVTAGLESKAKEIQTLKRDLQGERAQSTHAQAVIAMVAQVGFIITCPILFASHPEWIRARMESAVENLECLQADELDLD